jgi:hypothetical protein
MREGSAKYPAGLSDRGKIAQPATLETHSRRPSKCAAGALEMRRARLLDVRAARCYTWRVPTTRPRHTITETPPVQAALDELRSKLGEGQRIDFAELVTLGAQAKARCLSEESPTARAARKRLIDEVLHGDGPVDIGAAEEVKRLGLITSG